MIEVTPELAALLPETVEVSIPITRTYRHKTSVFHIDTGCTIISRSTAPTPLAEALERGLALCGTCARAMIKRRKRAG